MKLHPASYGDHDDNLVPRITIICLLLILYGTVGICLNIIWETSVIYTHLAYIPIVLSGVWWGRRSLIVAAVLAAFLLSYHLFRINAGALLSDLARCGFFVLAAFFVGGRSQKLLETNKSLSASEEKYRLLAENALTIAFVYTNDHKIIYANTRFTNILKFKQQDLPEMTLWDIVYKEDAGMVKELVDARLENPLADLRYESRWNDKNGKVLWMDVASGAIDFKGESAILVNAYDITARKEAELEREHLTALAGKQEDR
ncbi:MAG: PAS domain S-box protein [Pseudomonadota bacterium]